MMVGQTITVNGAGLPAYSQGAAEHVGPMRLLLLATA